MTLFKSFLHILVVPIKNDVVTHMKEIRIKEMGEYLNKGEYLAIIKIPIRLKKWKELYSLCNNLDSLLLAQNANDKVFLIDKWKIYMEIALFICLFISKCQ